MSELKYCLQLPIRIGTCGKKPFIQLVPSNVTVYRTINEALILEAIRNNGIKEMEASIFESLVRRYTAQLLKIREPGEYLPLIYPKQISSYQVEEILYDFIEEVKEAEEVNFLGWEYRHPHNRGDILGSPMNSKGTISFAKCLMMEEKWDVGICSCGKMFKAKK